MPFDKQSTYEPDRLATILLFEYAPEVRSWSQFARRTVDGKFDAAHPCAIAMALLRRTSDGRKSSPG